MSVAERQRTLIDDLLIIEDVQERLSAVVGRAAKFALPAESRVDANRVRGCVSSVWLMAERQDERWHFGCDADSPMVKGLVTLLCDIYQEGTTAEIIATEPELWERLGFSKLLSPTRVNGLAAVRARIREIVASA